MRNEREESEAVLVAPDRCTKYLASTPGPITGLLRRSRVESAPPARLLGVWAHPDDEAYLSAGLMARTVEAGGSVTVVTLTDGEEGFSPDDSRPASERAGSRRAELHLAMATIGVDDVRSLGLADGDVARAPEDEVIRALAGVIDEVRPDVVVTFGPDGITGHEDHVANWRLATRAWLSGEPNSRGELWYAAKTTVWLDEWRDLHDEFGVWMTREPTGVHPDQAEVVVDLDARELEQKRAVLSGHASQTEGLAYAFGEDRYRRWIREETFRRPSRHELDAVRWIAGRGRRPRELAGMVAR